jgi:hypothetical protein
VDTPIRHTRDIEFTRLTEDWINFLQLWQWIRGHTNSTHQIYWVHQTSCGLNHVVAIVTMNTWTHQFDTPEIFSSPDWLRIDATSCNCDNEYVDTPIRHTRDIEFTRLAVGWITLLQLWQWIRGHTYSTHQRYWVHQTICGLNHLVAIVTMNSWTHQLDTPEILSSPD